MDLGPLLLLGLGWLVLNAIRKAGSAPPGGKRPPEGPRSTALPGSPGTKRTSVAPGADSTQREGLRLEELFRELGRTLEEASAPADRAPADRAPADRAPQRKLSPAEEEEELESLEIVPEVRSLEAAPVRVQRVEIVQDDLAEQTVARRLKAAQAHSAPRTRADHRAFDARAQQEVADKTATRRYTARQLRDAVVWREILGPPVGLREEEER